MADRKRGELLRHGQYLSVNEAILRSAELLEDAEQGYGTDWEGEPQSLTPDQQCELGIGYALLALAEATWRQEK